tara:strand:- start:590 stop:1114 length:525 start_codon:yes stop_codon:yes gene_type:complete
MKNSWFLSSISWQLTLLLVLIANPVKAAPDLVKSVELIANTHYFREEAISLLYDKNINYEIAFSCKKASEQVTGQRIDALCIGSGAQNVLTLTIIVGDNGYASYVLVCPAGFDELDQFNIGQSAFQSEPTNFQGISGTSYYMGRTNGWIKDFENIFLTADMGFAKSSCWGLNKR